MHTRAQPSLCTATEFREQATFHECGITQHARHAGKEGIPVAAGTYDALIAAVRPRRLRRPRRPTAAGRLFVGLCSES